MRERKYTPEGLPVVSLESIQSFFRDTYTNEEEHVSDWFEIIRDENPNVGKYINTIVRIHEHSIRNRLQSELARLYILIRRQAESNKLDEELLKEE